MKFCRFAIFIFILLSSCVKLVDYEYTSQQEDAVVERSGKAIYINSLPFFSRCFIPMKPGMMHIMFNDETGECYMNSYQGNIIFVNYQNSGFCFSFFQGQLIESENINQYIFSTTNNLHYYNMIPSKFMCAFFTGKGDFMQIIDYYTPEGTTISINVPK